MAKKSDEAECTSGRSRYLKVKADGEVYCTKHNVIALKGYHQIYYCPECPQGFETSEKPE